MQIRFLSVKKSSICYFYMNSLVNADRFFIMYVAKVLLKSRFATRHIGQLRILNGFFKQYRTIRCLAPK